MSKLSIIMPAYNREKYIGKAIESILNQNFKDFELIIIDDGSTDQTSKIIKKFQDSRINYEWQENAGEYAATNKALKKTKGKYLTWVHSDDLLPISSLKFRVQALDKNPKIELVHGDIVKIDSKGKIIDKLLATNDDYQKIFNHYCQNEETRSNKKYFVNHLTFMFRREILNRVGYFDEKLPYAGDLDWMMRVIKKCTMLRIPKVLYKYRRHPQTLTRTVKKQGLPTEEITKIIQKKYCNF